MQSQGSWASDSIPGSPLCWRPSFASVSRSEARTRYTAFGHHLDPDAIPVFRLGYSCGNGQEGPLSAGTKTWLATDNSKSGRKWSMTPMSTMVTSDILGASTVQKKGKVKSEQGQWSLTPRRFFESAPANPPAPLNSSWYMAMCSSSPGL